jgi:NAD(P)-dependent dehydrogenase (short-subunit alcohol dehydrogenase family)
MRIEGANALVTGGASGLGAATARRLAAAGANVTIADVQVDKGKALADEIGGRFAEVDVTKPEMVEAAVNLAAEDGPLRISVTCAGVGWAQKTAGSKGVHPIEPFQIVVNINLVGTFNVLRYAAQKMIEGGEPDGEERGVIVNTASIAAFDGQMGQIAYAASKGGVVGLTLPAARDLSRDRIRVCTIAPGLFDTPLLAALPEEARTKLGESVPHPARLGTVEEYAQLAQHIIENPMLNGETIRLDGALRMAPR